jgi:hypothetical protein
MTLFSKNPHSGRYGLISNRIESYSRGIVKLAILISLESLVFIDVQNGQIAST